MSAPAYPGRAIQFGESDANVVMLVQRRLVERGCGPLETTGDFDNKTRSAVRLFQGRFPDSTGAPLHVRRTRRGTPVTSSVASPEANDHTPDASCVAWHGLARPVTIP